MNPPPAATPDPFEATAPFYDLDLEGYEDDVPLYRELALAGDGSVLELGCGTGRVAVPLAEAGCRVTGVDASPAMLAVAREQAQRLPVGALTLVQADMRTLSLEARFALVAIPLGGLQHLEETDDVIAALRVVRSHLAPEGLAVLDVEAPHAEDFEAGPRPLVEHWTRPWRGGQVTKLVAVENMPSVGLRHVTFHYDVQPPDGALRRVTHAFTLRVFTPAEIELAARIAGLTVAGCWGDYDGMPYDDGAARLIVTLEASS